ARAGRLLDAAASRGQGSPISLSRGGKRPHRLPTLGPRNGALQRSAGLILLWKRGWASSSSTAAQGLRANATGSDWLAHVLQTSYLLVPPNRSSLVSQASNPMRAAGGALPLHRHEPLRER